PRPPPAALGRALDRSGRTRGRTPRARGRRGASARRHRGAHHPRLRARRPPRRAPHPPRSGARRRSRFVKRFLTGTALVFGKELRVELRTREILVTAGLFGLLVTVLTSLAFFLDDVTSQKIAPGVLWVSACFAAILAMGRTWARERESDALRGLLLSPIPRSSIYAGKMLGTLVLVLAIDLVLLPAVAILFRLEVLATLLRAGPILFLGSIGYVARGTLFASMSVRTGA